MSWFSNLVETYDKVSDIAGLADTEGCVLLPLYHMMMNSDICVTIDGEGHFRRAHEERQAIIIPCTDDSAVRANKPVPHPLHENLGYLTMDENKRGDYLRQLGAWSHCHPKVAAVYTYLLAATLPADLRGAGLKADTDDADEPDERGEKRAAKKTGADHDKIKKQFIRFRVEIAGDLTPNLWEDRSVARAWQEYYTAASAKDALLCYATGAQTRPRSKHPKGINPAANGAKLISCNDEANFTYRGRFISAEQASAIGAEASHKSHAMLTYLIATQGHKCDSQAVVAWGLEDGRPQPDPFDDSFMLCENLNKTEIDRLNETQAETERLDDAKAEMAHDYALMLRDALRGKGQSARFGNIARRVAVMALDAATTGRMSITFYQEMPENEYLERIIDWHTACRWWFWRERRSFVSAPSVNRIIAAVYGEPKGEGYVKIQKQARARLLSCIVCGEPVDRSWIAAAVARVSNPFSYDKQDGGWDRRKWENALAVVCGMVRKNCNSKKEVFTLQLDTEQRDRSYLFGRLLALADRIESHARYVQTGSQDTEKRPTNAVRYMSAFASRPLRSWNLIYKQLNPYIQRLDGAEWYQRQIDEIMSLFGPDDFCDTALDGKYLLGYSLQRRALYTKEEKTNESEQ